MSDPAALVRDQIRRGAWGEALTTCHGMLAASTDNVRAFDCVRDIVQNCDDPEICLRAGDLLRAAGAYDRAYRCYRRAARLRPDSYAAWMNAGLSVRAAGAAADAIAHFRRACAIDHASAEVRLALGMACAESDQYVDAVNALREALRRDPRNPDAWFTLGTVIRDMGAFSEADRCYQHALRFDPKHIRAATNRAEILQKRGRTGEAIALYRCALAADPDCDRAASSMLLALHYDPGMTAGHIAHEHRVRGSRLKPARAERQDMRVVIRDEAVRIGYVSPDFRTHSVAWFLAPLLAAHDRKRVAVYGYAQVARPDAMTRRLRGLCDHWRTIDGVDDDEVGRLIARDRIDILVDLAGHTAGNRLRVFARRAAPVQVTWLGYPDTTGLDTMDYRLTDAIADPPGVDHLYTERLVRLPNGFVCYRPPDAAPAVRKTRQERGVRFGSFNNPAKITDGCIEVWSRILRETPHSTLLLKASLFDDRECADECIERFTRHGVSAGRVTTAGRQRETHEHLGMYNQIDIALDTFPYNGTTTTCEAFWMGTPVVTVSGETHASRVGESLAHRIGAPRLATHSIEEYIATAADMAADHEQRGHYHRTLRDRMIQSALCDAPGFARDIENAFLNMTRRTIG
jgi:predicted O-linked N-acetylglucosamine transferase (SPINDLY family)